MDVLKRIKDNKRAKEQKDRIIKTVKKANPVIDYLKEFSILRLFKSLWQAIKFVVVPIFTSKDDKTGDIKFNPVYFYIFLSVVTFFISVGQLIYMIHQVAFGDVNNPVAVLTASGGLVGTLIIIIDRMMVAYNKGKNGKE
jgi:hypothetical protein